LDGAPARIHRTNYLFRGVVVPAGTHRVTFVFTPRAFYFGAAGSLVGVGAIALLLCVPPGRQRPPDGGHDGRGLKSAPQAADTP
jgi:hypothetical protein